MPSRVQGLQIALGSAHQSSISSQSGTYNRFLKLDTEIPYLLNHTETDANEIGKGNEFISNVFLTNVEGAPQRMEKYGSAEWMAWAWGYALGVISYSSSLYTIHPIDPGVTIELPYWSLATQLYENGTLSVDEIQIGNVIESVETVFKYGPGRDSVKTTIEYVSSGQYLGAPTSFTMPSVLSEHYARSSGMTISINGVDYVSAKTALMGTISWRNNVILPMRYFPGSGLDSHGFAQGGRILIGVRKPTFTFTAFLTATSTEYAKLVAQTSGSATVTFTYDATHYVTFTFNVVKFEMVERVQEEGIVAVTVTVAPIFDPTVVGGLANNVVVVTSKNAITDIGQ